MSMTLEDLIKLIAMLGIPTVGSVAWLITMLMSIKSDIKKIEVQLEMRNNVYDDRITKLEKHVHDIRNSLQALTIGLARKGIKDESEQG
jgi:hypothetical protein